MSQATGADDSAYAVWTRYDRVRNDGKEQYLEQYDRLLRQYPKLTKQLVLGTHAPGPRHRRDQGHAQRAQHAGRPAAGRALQRAAARA